MGLLIDQITLNLPAFTLAFARCKVLCMYAFGSTTRFSDLVAQSGKIEWIPADPGWLIQSVSSAELCRDIGFQVIPEVQIAFAWFKKQLQTGCGKGSRSQKSCKLFVVVEQSHFDTVIFQHRNNNPGFIDTSDLKETVFKSIDLGGYTRIAKFIEVIRVFDYIF
jgi:hypothetical protein